MMTVHSNDTLGNTSFNWISSVMLIKVFSVLSMFLRLSTLPPRVCWRRRGGGKQASCLVAKQAVEFPLVAMASVYINVQK